MTQRTLGVQDGDDFLIAFIQGINWRQICWCLKAARFPSSLYRSHSRRWLTDQQSDWQLPLPVFCLSPPFFLFAFWVGCTLSDQSHVCLFSWIDRHRRCRRGLRMQTDVPGLLLLPGQNLYYCTKKKAARHQVYFVPCRNPCLAGIGYPHAESIKQDVRLVPQPNDLGLGNFCIVLCHKHGFGHETYNRRDPKANGKRSPLHALIFAKHPKNWPDFFSFCSFPSQIKQIV